MDSLPEDAGAGPLALVLARFRQEFQACLTARRDEVFELADAVLCAGGPVRNLAALSLVPEHRRALYDAVNSGRIEITRLRRCLADPPLPRAVDGRLMLAVDVSNWLRPGAATSPDRLFCQPCDERCVLGIAVRREGEPRAQREQIPSAAADHASRLTCHTGRRHDPPPPATRFPTTALTQD